MRQRREQRPVTGDPRMRHEFVLIDQARLRLGQWEGHTSDEQSLTRLQLELLHGVRMWLRRSSGIVASWSFPACWGVDNSPSTGPRSATRH